MDDPGITTRSRRAPSRRLADPARPAASPDIRTGVASTVRERPCSSWLRETTNLSPATRRMSRPGGCCCGRSREQRKHQRRYSGDFIRRMTTVMCNRRRRPRGPWSPSTGCAVARVRSLTAATAEKPCGGGLTLGPPALQALPGPGGPRGNEIARGTFSDGGRQADVALATADGRTPALVVSSRQAFDQSLLDAAGQAGSELVPERVTAVARSSHGWTLTAGRARITAGWLIGADGANSLVRRSVVRPFPRCPLDRERILRPRSEQRPHRHRLHQRHRGYLWSFPRTIISRSGPAGRQRASSAALLQTTAGLVFAGTPSRAPAASARYSWPIPSLSEAELEAETPSGDGWLLVGDAAGLVDPITREGLFYALASAALAAESLMRDHAASRYAAQVRRTIHSELRKAARLKQRFFRHAFSGLLLRALADSAPVRAVMADLITGDQTYAGLRRRLLMTGEFRLAAKYLSNR